jgi:hypothetical protein
MTGLAGFSFISFSVARGRVADICRANPLATEPSRDFAAYR